MKRILIAVSLLVVAVAGKAQIKVGDQPTILSKAVALDVRGQSGNQGLWLPRVSDTSVAGIRALNPPDGLLIYHTPSNKILLRANGTWVTYMTSGVTSVSAAGQSAMGPDVTLVAGTAAGGTNDVNISANATTNTVTVNVPTATSTVRGVVSTTSQTFGGAKTFSNGVTVNNGSTLNGGTTANGGLTVSGSSGASSNLTLGVVSGTTTSTVTTELLTVDGTGKVVLGTTNIEANKPSRVLNYTLTITGLTMAANTTYQVNAALPAAAAVSFPATVYISPSTILTTGTSIDWVTIINNNLVANISTRSNTQNLNGYVFYVTIVDF